MTPPDPAHIRDALIAAGTARLQASTTLSLDDPRPHDLDSAGVVDFVGRRFVGTERRVSAEEIRIGERTQRGVARVILRPLRRSVSRRAAEPREILSESGRLWNLGEAGEPPDLSTFGYRHSGGWPAPEPDLLFAALDGVQGLAGDPHLAREIHDGTLAGWTGQVDLTGFFEGIWAVPPRWFAGSGRGFLAGVELICWLDDADRLRRLSLQLTPEIGSRPVLWRHLELFEFGVPFIAPDLPG